MNDFLLKDYELKIDSLTNHYTRMWNRFNYFIGIETALLGGWLLIGKGELKGEFRISLFAVAILLSIVWYIMGAEDRLLVEVYRDHIKKAAAQVAMAVWQSEAWRAAGYRWVGEVEETAKELPCTILQWRWTPISTTRWVAILPLLVLIFWVVAFFTPFTPTP